MKKVIYLTLSIILLLGITTGCGCGKKNTNQKEKGNAEVNMNTNEEVIKDQELEVFTFTNTSLIYEDSTSVLTTVVTNTSNEKQFLKEFKIYVKDNDGNIIETLTGYIGDNIEGKSSTIITSSSPEDLSKAASIDYEIVR